jgi:hypothetical protein
MKLLKIMVKQTKKLYDEEQQYPLPGEGTVDTYNLAIFNTTLQAAVTNCYQI